METNSPRGEIPNHFNLPKRISGLAGLVYNLWWSWHPEVQRLFIEIDKDLWEQVYHNPVVFLRRVDRVHLNAAIGEKNLLEIYDRIMQSYQDYMSMNDTWFQRTYPDLNRRDRRVFFL